MLVIHLVVFAAFLVFAYRRSLTYLHVFQQDEYDGSRFLPWLRSELAIDRRVSFNILVCALVSLLKPQVGAMLLCVVFAAAAYFEANPLKSAKKALVMTSRAKRIDTLALVCCGVLALLLALLHAPLWLWIVPVQAIPFALVLAVALLAPHEKKIQLGFWKEAHEKLLQLKPVIVGVTGSYGKTSVKHILGHILETQGSTLITPGSVNTPMGISRIVREQLTRTHKYFVCEMGAYGPGSIARLCDLAPPSLGVIVSIGFAHHERFKSLEAVAKTKFELAEKTVANGGTVLASEAFLPFASAADFVAAHAESVKIAGFGDGAALRLLNTSMSAEGVRAEVVWRGETYALQAPVYGEHHAFNIALAFGAACLLGIAPQDARDALTTTPQIKHRLEVRREPNGTIVIDDAYNSNPTGFANALRMMDVLHRAGGRRILLTPGMVELGDAHDEQHAMVGRVAAEHADVVLAVKPERLTAMLEAYRAGNPDGTVLTFNTFAEAQTWIQANIRTDDLVLIENDLPDLYERRVKL